MYFIFLLGDTPDWYGFKIPIEQLGTLTALKYLQISQNKIVEVPQNLARLVSLEELDIANNKIKGVGPNCLPKGSSQ